MRVITWNCHVGGFRKKAKQIAPFRPDVLAVQEVEPLADVLLFAGDHQPTFRDRIGDPAFPKRAIGMFSYTDVELILGDFKDNASYRSGHWAELLALLHPLGLVSAYHEHFQEPFGAESRPTHYFKGNQGPPFHPDYCFVPKVWPDASRRSPSAVRRVVQGQRPRPANGRPRLIGSDLSP